MKIVLHDDDALEYIRALVALIKGTEFEGKFTVEESVYHDDDALEDILAEGDFMECPSCGGVGGEGPHKCGSCDGLGKVGFVL